MEKPRVLDLKQAAEILHEYTQPGSMIDNGNLFFAATEYRAAYDELVRERDGLRNAIADRSLMHEDHVQKIEASRLRAISERDELVRDMKSRDATILNQGHVIDQLRAEKDELVRALEEIANEKPNEAVLESQRLPALLDWLQDHAREALSKIDTFVKKGVGND